jgi:tetratricopeptide (TPR) repeat protein
MAALAYAYEDIFGPVAGATGRLPADQPVAPARSGGGSGTAIGIAVGAAAAVVFIAILGLLAAVAIPNFVRAREHAQQAAAQRWTQQGWQLWQAQKLGEAEAKFQQAVQLAPGDADAWNGLGWAQFNAGNSAMAETSFRKAIAIETNQPGALNGLGQIYLSQRKYDDAEKFLLQAAPKAPAAWFGLARLYLLEGKFDQAEKWAQNLEVSSQADETARKMLEAAKAKKLSEGLRLMIEPPEIQPPPSHPTEITASHMTYDASAHTLTANGPVVIRYGTADHSTNFGPVIERFLPASSRPPYNESNYLDLDSGNLLSLGQAQPPVDPFNVEQFYDWRQKSGADVTAQIVDDSDFPTNFPVQLKSEFRGLVGLNTVLLPVDKAAWDSMSSEAVVAAVVPVKPDTTHWTMATTLTNGLPATHLFKTSEGGMGILQITGFTDNPRGVKLRYKLVQNESPK